VLPVLAASRLLDAGAKVGGLLNKVGLRFGTDIEQMAHGHSTLADGESRAAFLHTLRSVVDYGGQRVNASNRLYLAQHVPFLMIWGEHDSIIPAEHGRAAHEALPGSELVSLPGEGHNAMDTHPDAFVAQVEDWLLR
jgi:pimeloyl-ACP methyl ester carboxylesterase